MFSIVLSRIGAVLYCNNLEVFWFEATFVCVILGLEICKYGVNRVLKRLRHVAMALKNSVPNKIAFRISHFLI